MTQIHQAIANDLQRFRGHLECTSCGVTQPVGDIATNLATGWPKHCGYTMSWITANPQGASEA